MPHSPFSPPPTNRETFKDLLVFEERLKQNAERLQRQRIKYEAFLVTIIVASLLLAYKTFIAISPYKLIHYLYVALFLVSITTLILFFATGMYTDQIAYAYKFIPQTNRALRPFNMFLITPSTASSLTRASSSGRVGRGPLWLLMGLPFKQLFQRRPPAAPSVAGRPPRTPRATCSPPTPRMRRSTSQISTLGARSSSPPPSARPSSTSINCIEISGKSARKNASLLLTPLHCCLVLAHPST
ncbi:hypothetical protein PCANC_22233 [Puccinia coronata f. sp. avenae]|uniref:Transmembrane protein 188 n=1 Tax=Puccinia coronata f. sp. avenae TaxID=200324 RepID=A0A2N5S8V9_9BASI|nr:hypothetical protein PCANC_22233 [Puccinia coronata f. sp. avenae]